MTVSKHTAVTMADLRQACEDRLDAAISTGEEGLRVGDDITTFETPAGVEITRWAGGLTVRCDWSDITDDAPLIVTRVEFAGWGEPPEVTETDTSRARVDQTVPRARHAEVAKSMAKYVTLIP